MMVSNKAVVVALLLAMPGSACLAEDGEGSDGDGRVSFAAEIAPIFSARCGASCHLDEFAATSTGLPLNPEVAWESLIEGEAWPCGLPRPQRFVDPGSPETSMLWRRLSGDVGVCGWMPGHSPAPLETIDPEAFDLIEQWIREGASNN